MAPTIELAPKGPDPLDVLIYEVTYSADWIPELTSKHNLKLLGS
jgi:hypothetical protein